MRNSKSQAVSVMGYTATPTHGSKATLRVLLALGVLLAGGLCAAEETGASAALDTARGLLADGQAAEARSILEKVVKDHTGKPEAEKARKLIDRIRSVEVLVDFSHEAQGAATTLPRLLLDSGIGVTRNQAYLPSLRSELSTYELIVLWQEKTDVPYDDLEYAILLEYLREGGHLLLVTNPGAWLRATQSTSTRRYPLPQLAKRLGLKLKEQSEELTVEKGRVFHYRNAGYLVPARLRSKSDEVKQEVLGWFLKFLPYPKLEDSRRNRLVPPEISFKENRVTFFYPLPLKAQALWARKALPGVLAFYRNLFKEDLANDITIVATAGVTERFFRGTRYELSLCMPRDAVLHHLALHLFQAWMQPEGGTVAYPHRLLERGWGDMIVLDLLQNLGVADRYARRERYNKARFQRADPQRSRIDVSIPPKLGDYAHFGKCEYIFRDLAKRYGYSMVPKFRETVFLYHRAGKLPQRPTVAQTIRLLSLAVGEDLFPYFRSLGTRVRPLPIDLTEPERLRSNLAEKQKGVPQK